MPDDVPLEAPAEGARRRLPLLMLTHNLWLIAAAVGAVLFLSSMGFDLVLLKHKETPLAIVVSNALVAGLGAALVFILLGYGREQRRQVAERMEALNEVNHHIRNALQSLTFTAGALKGSKQGEAIGEAVERIQWALLEVLPRVEPAYEPLRGSAREAAQRSSPQGPR